MSEITEALNSLALASVLETPISNVIAINSNAELAQKSPEDATNVLDSNNNVVALPLATSASVPLLSAPDTTKDSDEEVAGDLEKPGESTMTTKALENKKKREKKKRAAEAKRKQEVQGIHFSIFEALAEKYPNLTTDQLKHGEDFPRSNQRKPVAADFKWKGPVIEATKDRKCSYIDLIANHTTPQGKPAVDIAKCFASHVYSKLAFCRGSLD